MIVLKKDSSVRNFGEYNTNARVYALKLLLLNLSLVILYIADQGVGISAVGEKCQN